jgi:hypothetical protein
MEFVNRLMTRRTQSDAVLDEVVLKKEQTPHQEWESVDFTRKISTKSIRSWVRLVTLTKVACMQDQCASVIRYVAEKNQAKHEEQMEKLAKGLGTDLKTIRQGKGVKKETHHQSPHLARQLGKPLSRGKVGPDTMDPVTCPHPLLDPQGNGAKLWWKCSRCASRWERHHGATEVKKEEPPSFQTLKSEQPSRFMAQPVPTSRAQSSAASQASMDDDTFSEVDEMDGFHQPEEMRRLHAGFLAMVHPTMDTAGRLSAPPMTPVEAMFNLTRNPSVDKKMVNQFGTYLVNKGIITLDELTDFAFQSPSR